MEIIKVNATQAAMLELFVTALQPGKNLRWNVNELTLVSSLRKSGYEKNVT